MNSKEYSKELTIRAYANKKTKVEIKPSPKSEMVLNMKPKIPKSGTSLYDGFYIKKIKRTQMIYHIESELYMWSLPEHINARAWIDEKYDKLLAYIDRVEKESKGLR